MAVSHQKKKGKRADRRENIYDEAENGVKAKN